MSRLLVSIRVQTEPRRQTHRSRSFAMLLTPPGFLTVEAKTHQLGHVGSAFAAPYHLSPLCVFALKCGRLPPLCSKCSMSPVGIPTDDAHRADLPAQLQAR